MLAFAGPPPALARPLPQRPHFAQRSDLPFLAFDSEDELDDADDFDFTIQLDNLEEYKDVNLKPPSKPSPRTLVTIKKHREPSVPKALYGKKSVKVVTDVPTTALKPANSQGLISKERKERLSSLRSRSVRDHGYSHLAGLAGSTWEEKAYEFIRIKKLKESSLEAEKITDPLKAVKAVTVPLKHAEPQIHEAGLIAGLELEQKCQPVVDYLLSLGLDESTLKRIVRRRKACFYVKINKVKERLEYLMSLGMKHKDIGRVLTRHPQVMEYTVDRMMKPRVEYLQSIGIPETRLGRILTVSPSLLECSLEGALKRRVRFLVEEVGVKEGDVSKIVLLSPQVLTQSIKNGLRPRLNFLLEKVGMSQERIARMVRRHPQFLHYSISEGIQPRIDFFRSIGLSDRDIAVLLSRSSQVLSLSVEKSLKPKCDYLTKELKCGLHTIVSLPAYLSLSLEQRIRPRHEFLKFLKRVPTGPFPMGILLVTDEDFCSKWAKSTVEDYWSFRKSLLLSQFAKQFEKKNRLQLEK